LHLTAEESALLPQITQQWFSLGSVEIELRRRAAPNLVRMAIAKHARPGIIAIQYLPFHAGDRNSRYILLKQQPVALLRPTLRRLRSLAIGDITRHPAQNRFGHAFRPQRVVVFRNPSLAISGYNAQ